MKNYRKYIKSKQWFSKHDWYLIRSWRFCALIPLIPIGKWGKIYFPYNIHHMNYDSPEWYGIGVIALNPWCHNLLHGFKPAGMQKGGFPNGLQIILHWWCRLHILIKWSIIGYIFSTFKNMY
jgi:hypothetical protein